MTSFGHTLLEHAPRLWRYARTLTGNASDADDLVQECLARLLSKRLSWRGVKNPRAYLFTSLRNLFVGQMNRRRRERQELESESPADGPTTAPRQIDSIMIGDLDRALRLLPGPQREVILLVGLEGLKYCEAASVLGVPVGTVMSRLSRGRESLRTLMERERGPEAPDDQIAKLLPPIAPGSNGLSRRA